MVVPITFSETGRNTLGVVTASLCALLAFAGVCVIGVGVFIKYRINDELILLESYNSDVLPMFLVSVGTLMALINGASIKIIYDSGFAETSEKFRMVLLPVAVVMFLFIVVILVAGILTLAHRSNIEEALHDGLKDAMKRYKDNLAVKVAIDRVQMRSHCCGSISYKDWFNIGWINTDYVNKADSTVSSKIIRGELYVDNVPFSCCDVKVRRPCVTHDILDKTKHIKYDSVTLYRSGCTSVLMNEYENYILKPTGSTVMVLFGIQFLVLVLLRYLQTSVQSAYEEGDPEGPGKGSILPGSIFGSLSTGNPEKYQEEALKRIHGDSNKVSEPVYDSLENSPTDPLYSTAYSTSPGYMPDMEAVNDRSWRDEGGIHRGEGKAMSHRETPAKQDKHHHQQQQQQQQLQQQKQQQQKQKQSSKTQKTSKPPKPQKQTKSPEKPAPSKKLKSSKQQKPSKKAKSSQKSKSPQRSKSPKRAKSKKRR